MLPSFGKNSAEAYAEYWWRDQVDDPKSIPKDEKRKLIAREKRVMREAQVARLAMAMLAKAPQRTMRMSDLAELTSASLSRLSHLVKRLESRGYVRREADSADGRFTNAILLPAGMSKLESAAPGHVAYVRQLVIDNLSPERLRRLGQDADRIVQRIDSPAG